MRAFGYIPSRPMPLAGPGVSFGEFKIDPAVATALIEAGSAVATTAIQQSGKSSKRPKKRKAAPVAETSVETSTTSPAPVQAVPWGPIALGSAAVLALAIVMRRPVAPAPPPRVRNPRCGCRRRGRYGR